jgi:hypothetical protein
MRHLDIPVPPMLEQAIGYDGEGRWVAFYWMPGGDEVIYDDGRFSTDGTWQAYLLYVQHATVAPHLAAYNLGNSDQEAEHYLLLDRQERRMYVATIEEAQRVLHDQWPREDVRGLEPLTVEDWQRIEDRIRAQLARPTDMREIEVRMREEQAQLQALATWLDQRN